MWEKEMERCKQKQREERGQGAETTNERSLLFSQLFLSVPWAMLYTRPETTGMKWTISASIPQTHTLNSSAWTQLKTTSLWLTWSFVVTMVTLWTTELAWEFEPLGGIALLQHLCVMSRAWHSYWPKKEIGNELLEFKSAASIPETLEHI